MFTSQSDGDAAGAPRKRILFKNRPAWAKVDPSVAPAAIDDDPFSRTNETYARLEQERLREKDKAERQKKETAMELDGNRSAKRRRIGDSSDDDDDDASAKEEQTMKRTTKANRHEGSSKATPPPFPDGKSAIEKLASTKSPGRSEPIVVNLDVDSEDEDGAPPTTFWSPIRPRDIKVHPLKTRIDDVERDGSESESERLGREAKERLEREQKRKNNPVETLPGVPKDVDSQLENNLPHEEEQTGSDAEYEKLAKEARERVKREEGRKDDRARLSTPPLPASHPLPTPTSARPTPPPSPDPTIKLFIHSRIPNTSPLIVNIRLSQRLKEVRVAWISRQPLTDKQKDEIFFTWRRNRVFDFTTCKSLGVSVDEDGEVYIKGQTQLPGMENTQLEMEATTREMLDDDRRLREKPAEASPEKPAAEVAPIRIILKAKGFEDYKLFVKPTTKFGQIASVFRRVRGIALDKSVSLVFDGEKLNEQDEMQNSEVSDMDNIEMHVK